MSKRFCSKLLLYILVLFLMGYLYYSFNRIHIYDYELYMKRMISSEWDSAYINVCFPCLGAEYIISEEEKKARLNFEYFYSKIENEGCKYTIPLNNLYLVDSVSDYLTTRLDVSCNNKFFIMNSSAKFDNRYEKYNIIVYKYGRRDSQRDKKRWKSSFCIVSLFKDVEAGNTDGYFNCFSNLHIFSSANLAIRCFHFHLNTTEKKMQIDLDYQVPVNFLCIYPEPDFITPTCAKYYCKDKIDYIHANGLSVTTESMPNKGIQDARNIVIATLFSLLFSKTISLLLKKNEK